MIVQEPVQAAIWHCLNHYAFDDAIFLAERLCAEVDSDETLFLLATSYYRSGKPGQAYSLLRGKGPRSPQCKFLMAKCCMDLNKLGEAEAVLTGGTIMKPRSLEDILNEFGDSACFAMQLLAKICARTERTARSSEAFRKSLKLNPFLWNSFECLCNQGEKPDPSKIFQVSNLENFSMCHGANTVVNFFNCQNQPSGSENCFTGNVNNSTTENLVANMNSTPMQTLSNLNAPLPVSMTRITPEENEAPALSTSNSNTPSVPVSRNKQVRFRSALVGAMALSPLTPSFGVLPLDTPSPGDISQHSIAFLSAPPVLSSSALIESNEQKFFTKRIMCWKDGALQPGKPTVFSQSGNTPSNAVNISTPATQQQLPPLQSASGQNVRRSSRLFSNSNSVKENNKSPAKNRFVTPKSPSRKAKSRLSKTSITQPSFNELNEKNKSEKEKSETVTSDSKIGCFISKENLTVQALSMQKQSAEGLMNLLQEMGTAYLHLAQYNCRKAIECLNSLPSQQYNTGWVLSYLGKAYFELAEYQQAVKFFSEVREREPFRMDLMEYYSTALWHLQREVSLSALAQDLVAQDRGAAPAWCASGNCFSLQKEHESAIKFFQRAVQVDASFAYAYTLLGHEYVLTEELDKAMSWFRSAVRIDPRHYNAWYGIGMIYYKQERYQLAEIYFKKALSINPYSSVLMCHIGVVQHALQKTDKALQTLNMAIAHDPRNPLCKFHRASIYFATDRHQEALKELEELKEIVPKESLVYFLIGKVHNKLGNTHLALMHFSWAMDLDPKGANSQIKEAIDPAINRASQEDDDLAAISANDAEEYPSDGSTFPAQELSSQESLEYPQLQAMESDESL